MRFRHSVNVTVDNFICVFKLLLYRLITGVVLGSVAYVILALGLAAITNSAEAAQLTSLVRTFFEALFTGETEVLGAFQNDFHEALGNLLVLIGGKSASIIGCVVGLVLIYLLTRFVNGIATVSVGGIVSDRMSTHSHTTFAQSTIKNIGKAALYQVIYVPVCFLYDALTLLACWFFFFYAPSFLPSWGFPTVVLAVSLTLTAIVLLQSLKMTLVSSWLPAALIDGVPVTAAFRASLSEGKGFGTRFINYLVANYAIVAFNVMFAIFTVGSALLITVPLSFLFLLSMQFVNYFAGRNRRFFVADTLAGEEEIEQP